MKKLIFSTAIVIGFSIGTAQAEQANSLGNLWNSFTDSVQNFVDGLGNKGQTTNDVTFKKSEADFGFISFEKIQATLKNNKNLTETCPTGGYYHNDGGGIAYMQSMALCPAEKTSNPYINKAQWLYYFQHDPKTEVVKKGEGCAFNGKWRCEKWTNLKQWYTDGLIGDYYEEDPKYQNWNYNIDLKPISTTNTSVKKLVVAPLPEQYENDGAGCFYVNSLSQYKQYIADIYGEEGYYYLNLDGKVVKLKDFPASSKTNNEMMKFNYDGYTLTVIKTGKAKRDQYSSTTPLNLKVEAGNNIQNIRLVEHCSD